MRVWVSVDHIWRVEERRGRWSVLMHGALMAEGRSQPEIEGKLAELGAPALSEMQPS